MKRLAAFLLPFILCTVTAWSAEHNLQTMYLKTQAFAYLYPSANDEYAAAVYGKGEAVKPVGWRQGYCIIKHLGQSLYLPEKLLTSEKPRWNYFVTNAHRKLTLRENCVLYTEPAKSAETVFCSDKTMYTLGETKRWYKLYTDGRVVFIRKDSSDILKNEKAEFPEINISCSCDKENFLMRIRYFYCFLPAKARNMMGKNLKIHVVNAFEREEFEKMGAGAYASSDGNIYLKEKRSRGFSGMIEQCLLHEFGHMIQYSCRESGTDILEAAASLMEKDSLTLREHYQSSREYLAETFEMYIKKPESLKEYAPETWDYFFCLFQ